ncbi:ABL135Cp [Eremothecium gossypii ATCC 10895]|uniref:ABL135Cp n=1 Tax=Eremothecium gossypii (strain ATCC 10895 / CBS 109.51 / FGSC 9923 / NRRL Y-1056) TaxID=284811 RepID=Q75E08_EREGS|nr:ABL135Cp [Eremothecium gossypii ATCC 10895]AAS50636.2 ABL135Cp [Eremothecium gossypii ATCC 10895]AEY94924.1 FABL135Cp [Eremothecium gossypii FDAG1]
MGYNNTSSPIGSGHGSSGVEKASRPSSVQSTTQMGARHSESMNLSVSWLSTDAWSAAEFATLEGQRNRTESSGFTSTSSTSARSDRWAQTEEAVGTPQMTFVVYSQRYKLTASYTTLCTLIPTTTTLPYSEAATYSAPTTVITTDIAFYKGLVPGDDDKSAARVNGAQKRTIIGSVVGSVCGLLMCAMAAYYLLHLRRQRRKQYSVAREFTHELGRRLEYTTDPDEPAERAPPGRGAQRPTTRGGNARGDRQLEKTADPFGDEYAGLGHGPEAAALPVSGDAYFTSRYSYVSSMDETTTDQQSDNSYSSELDSIPIHLAPNERTDRQHMGAANTGSQSFLKEVI